MTQTKLFDIALLNCCTYTCDYCYAKASRATAINYDERGTYIPNGHMLRAQELIAFLDKAPKDSIIQLTGGEPILYPAFELLAARLLLKFKNIIVNTNANQLWRIPAQLKNELYWRPSWHRDYRNMEAFLEDIKDLPKEKTLINYVAHPKRIENNSIREDLLDLEIELGVKNGYRYEITCFEGEWNGLTYNKTWQQYIPISTFYTRPMKPIDAEYTCVRPNGDIFKCHSFKIGNIYSKEIAFNEELCKCSLNNACTCGLAYAAQRLELL